MCRVNYRKYKVAAHPLERRVTQKHRPHTLFESKAHKQDHESGIKDAENEHAKERAEKSVQFTAAEAMYLKP